MVVPRIEFILWDFDVDISANCSILQILSLQTKTPFLYISYIDVHCDNLLWENLSGVTSCIIAF